MNITFKQITQEKNIIEKEGFGTIVIVSLILLSLTLIMLFTFRLHPLPVALTMLLFAWVGRPFIRKFFTDKVEEKDIIGSVIFNKEEISWASNGHKRNQLPVSEISSLELRYNYINGRQFTYKDIIHNGLAALDIITNTGTSIKLKFLIETEEQLSTWKPIWKAYYKQGIKINETMGRYAIKTILFEKQELSFQQLKVLKEELNIKDN